MKIVCTICSRTKRQDAEPLPARERYTAPHIVQVDAFAKEARLPFYILSGLHGLVPAHHSLSYYDYRLLPSDVEERTGQVARQLGWYNIYEVDFYLERKESWRLYIEVMTEAAARTGTILVPKLLPTASPQG